MTPPTIRPVPQEVGPRVVIRQVSSAGRREVFLNPSEVRRLLDARVLETLGAVRTTSAEGSSGEGLHRVAQKTSQATTRE